jgi:hypothetical protein
MKKSRVNREDVESQTFIPYEETKRQLVGFLTPLTFPYLNSTFEIADNATSSFVTDILRSGEVDAEFEIILRDAAGSLYSGMFGFACMPLCGPTCTSGAVIATGSLFFTFMMAMAW